MSLKNDVFGLDTYFKFILSENEEYEEIEDEDRIVEEENGDEDKIVEEEHEEEDRIVEEEYEDQDFDEESDDSETSDDSDDDTLSSNLMCLSYTEKEYETEMTMGTLEYDWSGTF
ncbi:unnamed protein product [Meloidogyne enterolobii]|uniref:Uncharacterized protein n=1 Tax=Meloidogyne enterolobii TaxID=390850 RepID=A0ACB1ASH5_MELEN